MKKIRELFFSIRTKLIMCLFTVLAIMLVFADVIIYRVYRTDVEKKEISFIEDNNKIFGENIKNLALGIEENFLYEITRCNIFEKEINLDDTAVISEKAHMRALSVLMKFRGVETSSIFVVNRNKDEFFYSMNDEKEEAFQKKQIYKELIEKGERLFLRRGCTIWRHFSDEPEEIYIIKSYIDPATLEYKGIVCLTMEKSCFKNLLGENDFVSIIYDEMGQLLYCCEGIEIPQTYDSQGDIEGFIWGKVEVPKKKWTLIEAVSEEEAFASLKILTKTLLIVELVIFNLMMLVVYFVLKGLLKNIDALTDTFKNLNIGEEVHAIVPHSNDESAYLCEQFNNLYHRLQVIIKQKAEENTLRERAEYNALLAQLNPHFLYNTLESISSMAKLSGDEEIVKVIKNLSHLMRASLSGSEQEICLEQELAYINDYLELQGMITGGRIMWDIDVDEEFFSCRVPKLILQPIVENAILHGINEMLEGGMIVITAYREEYKMVLEVCDNGKGATQEELCRLLTMGEEPVETDRAHIGIKAIQKRLQILYGTEYGMAMESEVNNGMIVKISIPYTGEKIC